MPNVEETKALVLDEMRQALQQRLGQRSQAELDRWVAQWRPALPVRDLTMELVGHEIVVRCRVQLPERSVALIDEAGRVQVLIYNIGDEAEEGD